MPHPLDNPAWNALTTRQAHLAQDGGLARRFRREFGPFGAVETLTPESIAALAELTPPGSVLAQLQPCPTPAGLSVALEAKLVQMIAPTVNASRTRFDFIPLGDADAPEMKALTDLTRPGPFVSRTHTLGRFIGVREGGQLIAMAGERMSPEGFREVSAVCTHPDHRGRGLAGALLSAVAARIRSEGDMPFLHSLAENTAAVALYRSLGFEVRREMQYTIWQRPA